MEPVTHVLTGACLARAGLNRRAAYATVAMAIAAEFPDLDTIWSLRGPVAGFEHHRGITHTLVGIPIEAGLILLGVYGVHRFRMKRSSVAQSWHKKFPGTPPAPVRWPLLYGFLLLALLSHIALDYTNNYGVRPFFPFDPHWYAGSFVFIFDPLLFLLLVAGLCLPALFGLIGREIGAKREAFRGRGWARAALVCVLLLWSLRWFAHQRAVVLAQTQTLRAPGEIAPTTNSDLPDRSGAGMPATGQPAVAVFRPTLSAQRSLASPDPFSIFRWYTATDFGQVQEIGIADLHLGTVTPDAIFAKPPASPSLLAAERSPLGRVYMDWSPMPLISAAAGFPEEMSFSSATTEVRTITFADPRFMGDMPFLRSKNQAPLTGQVVISTRGDLVSEGMDGRFGR